MLIFVILSIFYSFLQSSVSCSKLWYTILFLFPCASLLIKKACSTEVYEIGIQTEYHKQLVIIYSLPIHCNNQMQTDWLEKALQLNITTITFKEIINGYDPFSTIFLMILQKVKVTFILSHLRKPFSIWSIYT